jgi:hypothetical protein
MYESLQTLATRVEQMNIDFNVRVAAPCITHSVNISRSHLNGPNEDENGIRVALCVESELSAVHKVPRVHVDAWETRR